MDSTASTSSAARTHKALFRSPVRCLLLSLRKSRQRWKLKAQARNDAIKVLKVRVSDQQASRQKHAQQALEAGAALRLAEQKIEQLQAELAHTRAALAEAAPAPGKKS